MDIKFKKKPIKIENHIHYYLEDTDYTNSFGLQWNKFRKTQIDTPEKFSQSFERFFNETGLKKEDFKNKKILEIGSGAGRFTNIILNHTEGVVYSIDSSDAVKANLENNKQYIDTRLFLFKASIYDLPFDISQFDIVICFGVLQHTPNISKSVKCLCQQTAQNGLLFLDFYPYNGFWTLISSKYILRPITKRMKFDTLYSFFNKYIKYFIRINFFLQKIHLGFLNRFIPIADIAKTMPEDIDKKLLEELVLLDTIDMLTPYYDMPQKISKITKLVKNNFFSITFSGKIKYLNYSSAVVRGKKN